MKTVIKLEEPAFSGDHYFCFGSQNVVVLEGRYDPRQMWLPFDGRSVLFRHAEPPKRREEHDPKKLTPKRINRKLAPPQHCMQPYFPEEGVEQYVLPIEKWQVPSKSLGKKIAKAGFPCFERDENGEVYRARHIASNGGARHDNIPLREWINRNCVGRVVLDGLCYFERADDQLFALVSGNFAKYE